MLFKFLMTIFRHSLARLLGLAPPPPYKLALSVTNRCNLRCKTCGVWTIYQNGSADPKEEISVEEFDKIFAGFGNHLYWLAVTGGEPFLRTDLEEIVESALKRCKNLLLVSFVTNGSQLERASETLRRLSKHHRRIRFVVSVSIDGDEVTHDRLRSVRGIHEKAVATLSSLEAISRERRNLSVIIETLVSTLNLKETLHFLDDALLKDHDHCFVFSQESDRYANLDQNVSLKKNSNKALEHLISKIAEGTKARNPASLLLKIYYVLTKDFYKRPVFQVLPCYSSTASVYVDALGNVRPCVMMGFVGNLRKVDYQISTILNSKEMKDARKRIASGHCPNCWTPCEAIQTIIQNFPLSIMRLMLQ